MKEFPDNLPHAGAIVRHQDGGFYQFLGPARHTEDQSHLCIYMHLWPFTPGEMWARPMDEWASRFTACSMADYNDAVLNDQAKAQQIVTEAKAARRAAEGR